MQWRGRRQSSNIEDRRSSGPRMGGGAGGGLGLLGVLAILAFGYFFGVDVTPLLQGEDPVATGQPAQLTQADQDAAAFVAVTLADTEEVWQAVFRDQLDATYQPPVLVLFKGATNSPCGGASGSTGPFYCPVDRKVYLDTDFFTTMERQLGAGGDFAAAYVVAHEVGHHVQNLAGILADTMQARRSMSPADSNAVSVMVELQADCLAGIWARHAAETFGSIERGDVDEAMNAARQIGDDTLQRNAGQRPMPHTFTHGTSEQRSRWFMTGLQSGQMADCDTFQAQDL